MAVSAPFCLSSDVAMYHPVLLQDSLSDFEDDLSTPSKTEVDAFIVSISNAILMRLAQGGWYVPLQDLDGETWPDHQTEMLKLMTIVGVGFFISGPNISNPGGRGERKSPFQQQYETMLNDLYNPMTKVAGNFRAKYRMGTPAMYGVIDRGTPATSRQLEANNVPEPGTWMMNNDYAFYLESKRRELHKLYDTHILTGVK